MAKFIVVLILVYLQEDGHVYSSSGPFCCYRKMAKLIADLILLYIQEVCQVDKSSDLLYLQEDGQVYSSSDPFIWSLLHRVLLLGRERH